MSLDGLEVGTTSFAECVDFDTEEILSEGENPERSPGREAKRSALSALLAVFSNLQQEKLEGQSRFSISFPYQGSFLEQKLESIVQNTREQAIAMGFDPKEALSIHIYIVSDPSIGAMAHSKWDPFNEKFCHFIRINDGILEKLNEQELKAIIGHEVSHIVRGDTTQGDMSTLLNSLSTIAFLGVGIGCVCGRIGKRTALSVIFLLALGYSLAKGILACAEGLMTRKQELRSDENSACINGCEAVLGLLSKLEQEECVRVQEQIEELREQVEIQTEEVQELSPSEWENRNVERELSNEFNRVCLSVYEKLLFQQSPSCEPDKMFSLLEECCKGRGVFKRGLLKIRLYSLYYLLVGSAYMFFHYRGWLESRSTLRVRMERIRQLRLHS